MTSSYQDQASTAVANVTPSDPVILYDDVCGFCNRFVQFVLKHDQTKEMKFAGLAGAFANGVRARHPRVRGYDSVLLVWRVGAVELVSARSRAVADILRYLGGGWAVIGTLIGAVPVAIADRAYAVFAGNRHRILGRPSRCTLPALDQRDRFLR